MRTAAIVLLGLSMLAACTRGPEGVGTTVAEVPGTPAEGTTPPTSPPASEGEVVVGDRSPLTGLALQGSPLPRVIAVKVDNHPDAQPQVALGSAELIQEIPVEGGLTRFNAFFYENRPQLVGPVRSARPTDAELLAPFQPLLAVSGGVEFVYRELGAAGVQIADEATLPEAFQRLERPMPHNLMATFELLEQEAEPAVPVAAGYPFGEGAAFAGQPAGEITISFSADTTVSYQYRPEQGDYLRSEGGAPFEVLPTHDGQPEPLSVETVVVQVVAQRSAGYTDRSGAEVPTFDVIGFGPALVFHGGEVVEGEWRRAAQQEGTLFFDGSGNPLEVPPGRLMVELVPPEVGVSFG